MATLDLSFASGQASLSVRRFTVQESISSLFTVSVWARSPEPDIDLESIVGGAASLRAVSGYQFAYLGGSRAWTGICSHIEQVEAFQARPGERPLFMYYLRIVPTLWLLTQRSNYRILQQLSVPDMVDRVLSDWNIAHAWKIDRARHPKLEYRVQYGETDYAFISRLLEEAGIAFTFMDGGDDGLTLVFADALHANAARPTPPLIFADNPNQEAEQEYVSEVRFAREVRPGAHTLVDYDFRRPSFPLFGNAPKLQPPEDKYEQYNYVPGGFLMELGKGGDTPSADDKGVFRHDQGYGHRRAERGLLSDRSGSVQIAFNTNAIDLGPGVVFSISGHPNTAIEASKRLLVTDFSVEGTQGEEWTMSARAVFSDIPFVPPLRTPKTRAVGVQSATVVGPEGEMIHTDEFGRVRVQFPWDRDGKHSDRSSCWMRVSQAWAGAGYGMFTLPRVGQEVLVGFLEGDPDQPLVVGRVFNAIEPVPYKLPEDKTISVWKSDSSPGSDGWNETKFEDRAGDELFYEQAQKNLRKLVKHDETITVLRHRQKSVVNDELDTTGVDRIEVTGINRLETVGSNKSTAVGANRRKLVKQAERARIEGSRLSWTGKSRDSIVKSKKRELVEADSHLHTLGGQREVIHKTQSLSVLASRQETVGGNYALEAGGNIHLRSGDELIGEAAQDVTLQGPGGFLRIDAGGVTISGTLVKINVGGNAKKGKGSKPEPPEEPAEAPPEMKDWIEIVLQDDGNPPNPIPFKRYVVELPDGTSREGYLDAEGRARIEGVDPGTCRVMFPELEDDWRDEA